jgi:flagellar hook assembly protein FlgD
VQADSERAAAPSSLAPLLLCALAAAVLLALAVVQRVKLEGAVLDLARVTRLTGPEAGQNRKVEVEFRMRSDSDDAVIRIVNRDEEPVATLAEGVELEGDERVYVFYWDGRDESGSRVPRGRYRVEILLRDQDREILPEEDVLLRGGGS